MKNTHVRYNVERPDGRPEAYLLPSEARLSGHRWHCVMCLPGVTYAWNEVVMASPIDASDGQAHIVCVRHTPDDIVIYDPVTNKCIDKQGNEWTE